MATPTATPHEVANLIAQALEDTDRYFDDMTLYNLACDFAGLFEKGPGFSEEEFLRRCGFEVEPE